jgi:hypothetical protein
MRSRVPTFHRAAAALAMLAAAPCFAAERGEIVDKIASGLALFIIVALPIGGIVLFWLVHVLPEKIAEKRQHPQKEAIHVLCLLSLVFGGLLWPLAWLWAYTKPVIHKIAYGRDKHDDFYAEEAAAAGAENVTLHEELGRLREDLEALEKRGELPDAMRALRERVDRIESRAVAARATGGTA